MSWNRGEIGKKWSCAKRNGDWSGKAIPYKALQSGVRRVVMGSSRCVRLSLPQEQLQP